MAYCNYNMAPLHEMRESKLNKKLNTLFPSQTLINQVDPNLNGVNRIYKKLREDAEFKKWFGDWTTPEGAKKIRENSKDRAILDDLDEPILYKDPSGNVYIRNIHNDWNYITKTRNSLSPTQMNEAVNTLTAEYILDGSISANDFVKQRIDEAYEETKKDMEEEAALIASIDDPNLQILQLEESENTNRKFRQLETLKGNDVLQDIIARRVKARLEKYHFKYDETADSKTDDTNYNDVQNFIKDSTDSTNRAINDPEILQFMSAIPMFANYDSNIAKQRKIANTLLNSPVYMAQGEAWRLLENYLSDMVIDPEGDTIDMFEVFKDALELAVKDNQHAGLHYISDFLNKIDSESSPVTDPESFKTKFVTAFHMARQNFLIAQTEIVEDKKNKGTYSINYSVIDPGEMTDPAITLANSYVNSMLTHERMVKAGPNDINEMRKQLIDGFKKVAKIRTPEAYINFLDSVFNEVFDMGVTSQGIKYYINKKARIDEGVYDFTEVKKDINKFLSDTVMNSEVLSATRSKRSIDGQFSLLSELKGNMARKNKPENLDTIKNFLFSKNSLLRNVGEADAIFSEDVSESTVLLSSGKQWGYSYVSGLHRKILKWKNGDVQDLLDLSDRNLFFANHILSNPSLRDLLKVYTNAEIRKKKDNNPTPHKKITELDYHIENLMKMFNSRDEYLQKINEGNQQGTAQIDREINDMKNYLLYNFGADKNSLFAIFGLPDISKTHKLYDMDRKEIANDMKRLLNGYVKGELKQINKAAEIIGGYQSSKDKLDYMMKHLIPGYHYKLSGKGEVGKHNRQKEIENGSPITVEEFKAGSYAKMGVFSEALNRYLKESGDTMIFTQSGYTEIEPSFLSEDMANLFGMNDDFQNLMYHVYDVVNETVEKDFKYLNDIVLINKENEETGDRVNVKLSDVGSNIQMKDGASRIYDYALSSFLIGYEFSNIFNGHIGFYKQSKDNTDISDFLKRAPASATNGQYLRMRDTRGPKTYTTYSGQEITIPNGDVKTVVAIANNIELPASEHDNLMQKASGNTLSMAHELADAQGHITGAHFREVIERTSGWKPKDTLIHDRLMDPNHKVTDEDIKWIKDKSYTPIKLVYYGLKAGETIDGVTNMTMPVYLKYSLAPLFPAMVNGTQMELLLKQMEDQGVEQLVFQSGSKAANHAPTTLHKLNEDGTYGGLDENMKLNPFEINTEDLKIQTEIPTKLDKKTLLGFQSLKNILTNLMLESNSYTFREKRYTGQEIYDKVNQIGVKLLNEGLNEVIQKTGYDPEKTGIEQFDVAKVKKLLIKQMDIETEQDLIQMLQTDLPMETIPNFGQRAFPVLSSYVKDTAGKIYTNGGSMVQVANIGYDRLLKRGSSEIFFFDDNNTTLKPPLPKTNANGDVLFFNEEGVGKTKKEWGKDFDGDIHKMRIAKAKILLPFASVFADTGMSYNDFIKLYKKGDEAFDKRIFNTIMGYRIPNQAMSSNDSFEIVGILPPVAGDQAIVYHEITAKTGSDFDIDKMYLAMPNFDVKRKISKDYVDAVEEMKKDTKIAQQMRNHGYYMTYKYPSGGHVLTELSQNKRLAEYMRQNGVSFNKKGYAIAKNPIHFIKENETEMMKIANEMDNENWHPAKDEDGVEWDITSQELIEDASMAFDMKRLGDSRLLEQSLIEKGDLKADMKAANLLYDGIEKVSYSDTGKKGLQNEFIELMTSILESPDSYNDLVSPLDNDIIKETINKIVYLKTLDAEGRAYFNMQDPKDQMEEVNDYIKENDINAIEQLFPVHLLKSRADVLEAKTLIAIMANNMTDIGESQKTDFAMAYDLGLTKEQGKLSNSLARVYEIGKENDADAKLSKLISYFMNASVDAAKDSYIISGNVNTYTANSVLMMARMGIKLDDILTITMNDTIMEHSRMKNFQKSKNANFNTEYSQKEMDDFTKALLEKMSDRNFDLWSVISREDFIDNNPDKIEDILGYWNFIQTMAKEFNNAVVAMKSESNGSGKNIAEMISLRNRLERVKYDGVLNSFKKWHKNGIGEDGMSLEFDPKANDADSGMKILGAMANNTLFFMENISQHLFIEGTKQAKENVNKILDGLGQPLSTDSNTIRMIQNYMYPHLLYKSGNPLFDLRKSDEKKLMQDFPAELHKYRNQNRDNKFLRQLRITVHSDKNLITFPSSRSFSEADRGGFKQDMMEIMNDTKEGEFKGLMDRMVRYAFLTTGFKSTYYSFNDMIPASYFINNDHGIYVKKMINAMNGTVDFVDPSEAFTMMAQVNHKNFKIVKTLSGKSDIKPAKELMFKDEKILDKLEIGDGKYAPFFKFKKSLYMKIGNSSEGYPHYQKIDAIDNRKFNMYPFYNTPEGLNMDSVTYESEAGKLTKNIEYFNDIQLIDSNILDSENKCNN